jgi:osmoprotectant transport system permease protein
MKRVFTFFLSLAFSCPLLLQAQSKQLIRVGAKHFNEGYILSEMIAILLEDAGFEVERKFHLGGTAVTFEALRNNAIDIYPEYSGTINYEILKVKNKLTTAQIGALVKAKFGLEISDSYGFNNTYALVMISDRAKNMQVEKISDLKKHARLTVGLSYEFIKRRDGWEALASFYKLPHTAVGLEHGLAYQAMLQNQIDITDAYSTDGEVKKYDLKLLKDDKHFFPDYHPVSFYTTSLPEEAKTVIKKLEYAISDEEMQSLNSLALFEKKSHFVIARDFLESRKLIDNQRSEEISDWRQIFDKMLIHIQLTLVALLSAVVVAFPLGLLIYDKPVSAKAVLYFTGILQTVPSIALLALMIPLFGVGIVPALVALFLYALLPILRNTVTGLFSVDPELKKVASAIGINDRKRLLMVEVPLAMPTIITGVRTAAVINVGTATLAAFIGAGGLGEFIVTGLALNDTSLILKGAIPAALLAIVMELGFEGMERILIPRHLRSKRF